MDQEQQKKYKKINFFLIFVYLINRLRQILHILYFEHLSLYGFRQLILLNASCFTLITLHTFVHRLYYAGLSKKFYFTKFP